VDTLVRLDDWLRDDADFVTSPDLTELVVWPASLRFTNSAYSASLLILGITLAVKVLLRLDVDFLMIALVEGAALFSSAILMVEKFMARMQSIQQRIMGLLFMGFGFMVIGFMVFHPLGFTIYDRAAGHRILARKLLA
jgi:hypothetical protein